MILQRDFEGPAFSGPAYVTHDAVLILHLGRIVKQLPQNYEYIGWFIFKVTLH